VLFLQGRERAGIAFAASLTHIQVQLLPDAAADLTLGAEFPLRVTGELGFRIATVKLVGMEPGRNHRGESVTVATLAFVDLSDSERTELASRLSAVRHTVLTVGLGETLVPNAQGRFRAIQVESAEEVLRRFESEEIAVLVLGSELAPAESVRILSDVATEFPECLTVNIVASTGSSPELFQEFVDNDQIFYLSREPLSAAHLEAVVLAGIERWQEKFEKAPDLISAGAQNADRLLDFSIRLSTQVDLPNAAGLIAEAVRTMINAESAQCLLYYPDKEILWTADPLTHEERTESAASGLAAFVARTGEHLQLERIGSDPRCDMDTDCPDGNRAARFIAEPVLGSGGRLIAVLTAVRNAGAAPFSERNARLLELLACCAAPTLSMILMHGRIQTLLSLENQPRSAGSDLFLQEALDQNTRGFDHEGDLLRTYPPWLKQTHWIICALVLAGMVYLIFGTVNEYAVGPAVVRTRNKIAITATDPGVVRSVEFAAGDRVRAGDLLVRFYDDPGASPSIRFRMQLRAPTDGVVSDVRVRAGQQVSPGDQLASVIDESAGYELIALLPGSYAPQIRPGMPMVLKLDGYTGSHETVAVSRVGTEIVGPKEAARYAGRETTDAIALTGPVVVVRSTLQPPRFTADGHPYNYRDGMTGQGEISVHADPIIVSLVPGLKDLYRRFR
jgi:membrane fusion protein (multidrug efflux system)